MSETDCILTLNQQPKIKAASINNSTKQLSSKSTKTDADDDSKWPEWTHIVYTTKTKASLLKQHQVVRGIVRHAIELAEIDVITRLAWPELETSRELYRRQILHRGAKEFEKDDKRAKDVKERVKGSMKYSAILGDLVCFFLFLFLFFSCLF